MSDTGLLYSDRKVIWKKKQSAKKKIKIGIEPLEH